MTDGTAPYKIGYVKKTTGTILTSPVIVNKLVVLNPYFSNGMVPVMQIELQTILQYLQDETFCSLCTSSSQSPTLFNTVIKHCKDSGFCDTTSRMWLRRILAL